MAKFLLRALSWRIWRKRGALQRPKHRATASPGCAPASTNPTLDFYPGTCAPWWKGRQDPSSLEGRRRLQLSKSPHSDLCLRPSLQEQPDTDSCPPLVSLRAPSRAGGAVAGSG